MNVYGYVATRQCNPIQFDLMRCNALLQVIQENWRFVSKINAFAYAQKYVIKQVECRMHKNSIMAYHSDRKPTLDNLFAQHTKSPAKKQLKPASQPPPPIATTIK